MKKLLTAFVLTSFTPSLALAQDVTGNWTGEGIQDGETWAMEVQIVADGARVDYPSIPCGGLWVFDRGRRQVSGKEWLTYGHDLCLDGLTVLVTNDGPDGILIRWQDETGAEIAHAPLIRATVGAKDGKKGHAKP